MSLNLVFGSPCLYLAAPSNQVTLLSEAITALGKESHHSLEGPLSLTGGWVCLGRSLVWEQDRTAQLEIVTFPLWAPVSNEEIRMKDFILLFFLFFLSLFLFLSLFFFEIYV